MHWCCAKIGWYRGLLSMHVDVDAQVNRRRREDRDAFGSKMDGV